MERRITRHAIDRYLERVNPSLPAAEAYRHLTDMAAGGSVRPKPRGWTPASPAPGTVFIYSADTPGVCLVATRDAVLTVLTRALRPRYRLEPIAGGHRVTRRRQVLRREAEWETLA